MGKIGIITHPLYINYGGILQNYALQQTLIKLGYSPITLRLSNPSFKIKGNYLINIVKWIVKKILGRKDAFPLTSSKKRSIFKANEKTIRTSCRKYQILL